MWWLVSVFVGRTGEVRQPLASLRKSVAPLRSQLPVGIARAIVVCASRSRAYSGWRGKTFSLRSDGLGPPVEQWDSQMCFAILLRILFSSPPVSFARFSHQRVSLGHGGGVFGLSRISRCERSLLMDNAATSGTANSHRCASNVCWSRKFAGGFLKASPYTPGSETEVRPSGRVRSKHACGSPRAGFVSDAVFVILLYWRMTFVVLIAAAAYGYAKRRWLRREIFANDHSYTYFDRQQRPNSSRAVCQTFLRNHACEAIVCRSFVDFGLHGCVSSS